MVRLTDRPDMTLDIYRGRKTTMQQQRFANSRFKKESWTEDYATETLYISNSKSNNDYVVRLFKYISHIILVFLDVLRTPNYSSEEMLIKSFTSLLLQQD